ncbi:MAG: hypothetical protein U0869_17325 [Chloroflexota bacterium]
MARPSFADALGDTRSFVDDPFGFGELPTMPTGGPGAPFDALDVRRLSGPSGSHPLAGIDLRQLISGPTGGLEGAIEIAGPARVGEAITGRIRIRARKQINARSAVLRLVGIRLAEWNRSEEQRDDALRANIGGVNVSFGSSSSSDSSASRTVSWVQIQADEIESLPFTEPALPGSLAPGQIIDLPFTLPAPRLGPPSGHAGVAAIAWALEAKWDIGFGGDERVAAYVDVRQHPDLLRAGVIRLPSGAMNDVVSDEGTSISVVPIPPVPAGTPIQATIAWPGAPGGRSIRVELTMDVSGATSESIVVDSQVVDEQALKGGTVTVQVPGDLPPTLEADDLTIGYRIRIIVDRKLRSDVSRERPVVLT